MLSSLYGVCSYMWPSQSSWTCVFSFSPIKGHDTNYREHALLAVSHEIHVCSHYTHTYRHLKEVNICGWRQNDSSITLGLDRIIKAVRNNWRYPFTSFQLWPLTFITHTHTHTHVHGLWWFALLPASSGIWSCRTHTLFQTVDRILKGFKRPKFVVWGYLVSLDTEHTTFLYLQLNIYCIFRCLRNV